MIGALRVVVYAEGPAELGLFGFPPSAGCVLTEDFQGPAHALVARCIVQVGWVPRAAVQFEQGLRKATTALPRGSDFLEPKILRRLLSWASAEVRPHLALVLIDEDGFSERYSALARVIADRLPLPPAIVAVCRQEFESWLLADEECVASVLGAPIGRGDPETWEPGLAKKLLAEMSQMSSGEAPHTVRRRIVEECNLEALARCQSFQRFLSDLEQARRQVLGT
jgi:hypothetical protein